MNKHVISSKVQFRSAMASTARDPVLLYVDNSNIYIEGQRYADQRANEDRGSLRIHFKNFLTLAARGRPTTKVVWGGSQPPNADAVWEHLRSQGIEPELIRRSEEGESETVDHAIQLRMHRHTREFREHPGVIVLCTGDGKGYYKREGFLYDVEGFVEDGWQLEILTWEHSCNSKLKEYAEKKGKLVLLDKFYKSITYIQGGRRAMPVDL